MDWRARAVTLAAGTAALTGAEISQSAGTKSAGRNPTGSRRSGQAIAVEHRFTDADRRPPKRFFRGQTVIAGIPGAGGDNSHVLPLEFPAAGTGTNRRGGRADGRKPLIDQAIFRGVFSSSSLRRRP